MYNKEYIDYLISWIKEKVLVANAKGVIVGLSGGIDSALVAALAKRAFPNDSLAIIMPIDDMKNDLNDIDLLVKEIKIKTLVVNLKSDFISLKNKLNIKNKGAISNIKPRLRMTTLYSLAQERNYFVLGTSNKVEWELGYFTKYGDGGADLYPIINLLKSQVNNLASILNVPKSIITKSPSAGLFDDQTDEKEFGFTYKDADNHFSKNTINNNIVIKINSFRNKSDHKRNPLIKTFITISMN